MGSVLYQLDENTLLTGLLAFSTLLDNDDDLDAADIDTTNFWVGVGAAWSW